MIQSSASSFSSSNKDGASRRRNIRESRIPLRTQFLDISNSTISSFKFLDRLQKVLTLKAENTMISNFANTPLNSSIRNIFLKGSPVSRYDEYRLMVLIALNPEIEYIDAKVVTKDERSKAKAMRTQVQPKLYEGFLLISIDPITLSRADETIVINDNYLDESQPMNMNEIKLNQTVSMMENLSYQISSASEKYNKKAIPRIPVREMLKRKRIDTYDLIMGHGPATSPQKKRTTKPPFVKAFKEHTENKEDLISASVLVDSPEKREERHSLILNSTQRTVMDLNISPEPIPKVKKPISNASFDEDLEQSISQFAETADIIIRPNIPKNEMDMKSIFNMASDIMSSPERASKYFGTSSHTQVLVDLDETPLGTTGSRIPININSPSKHYGPGHSPGKLTQTKFGGIKKISDSESEESILEEEEEEEEAHESYKGNESVTEEQTDNIENGSQHNDNEDSSSSSSSEPLLVLNKRITGKLERVDDDTHSYTPSRSRQSDEDNVSISSTHSQRNKHPDIIKLGGISLRKQENKDIIEEEELNEGNSQTILSTEGFQTPSEQPITPISKPVEEQEYLNTEQLNTTEQTYSQTQISTIDSTQQEVPTDKTQSVQSNSIITTTSTQPPESSYLLSKSQEEEESIQEAAQSNNEVSGSQKQKTSSQPPESSQEQITSSQRPESSEEQNSQSQQPAESSQEQAESSNLVSKSQEEEELIQEAAQSNTENSGSQEQATSSQQPESPEEQNPPSQQPDESTQEEIMSSQQPETSQEQITSSQLPESSQEQIISSQRAESSQDHATLSQPVESSQEQITSSQPPESSQEQIISSQRAESSQDHATSSQQPEQSQESILSS